jgi:hypothetical protein
MTYRDLSSEWTQLPPRGVSQLVLLGRETCPNSTKAIQGFEGNKYKTQEDIVRKHHLIKVYRRPWRVMETDRYGIPLTDNTNQLVRGGRLNWFRKVVFWRCWYCQLRVCVEKPKQALARKVPFDEAYGSWMHDYRNFRKMLAMDPVSGRERDMVVRQPWVINANEGETWRRVGQLELDLDFGQSSQVGG